MDIYDRRAGLIIAVVTVFIVAALVGVAVGLSQPSGKIPNGYVCQKRYIAAHLVGKTWMPAEWRVTIDASDGCTGENTSDYSVSRTNWDALQVGEPVSADEHGALFPAFTAQVNSPEMER